MRSVLITRPRPAADELARQLRLEGFEVHLAPLMEYVALDADYSDLDAYQALVFTSAQGVQVFAKQCRERQLPVLAVGDTTAQAAEIAGFAEVYSAKGDSTDIAALIQSKMAGLLLKKILHPCSEDTPQDIGAAVAGLGVEITQRKIYKARFLDALPKDVIKSLERGEIDAVTLFSARTAANLVAIMQQKGLRGVSAGLEAVCISPRVAEALKAIPWRVIHTARQPRMEAVLEILRDQAKKRKAKRTTVYSSFFPPLRIDGVIEAFGGLRPLANRLGITASTVQGWKKRGIIPEMRVESVLQAAEEDGIDTGQFLTKDKAGMTTGQKESHEEGERRKRLDRRQKHAPRDGQGHVRSPAYTGPDRRVLARRAHETQQQEVILQEKMNFLSRTVLTFACMFIAIVLAGVFLLAPEYSHLKDDKVIPGLPAPEENIKKSSKSPSLGGVLNSQIEKIENAVEPVTELAGNFSTAAGKVVENPSIEAFTQMLGNMTTLRNTPEGNAAVRQSLKSLRKVLASAPGEPEALNKALAVARSEDKTLDKMMGNIRGKDLAAAALLLTLYEFRSNVDNSRPYKNDLALLQKFAGNDPEMKQALDRLAPYAEKGAMNRTNLQKQFNGLATDIIMAKLEGKDISIRQQALKRYDNLTKAGSLESVQGQSPEEVTARAQWLMQRGDIKGAIHELQMLEGASASAAEPWMDNAAGHVIAEESSDAVTQGLLKAMSGESGMSMESLFAAIKEAMNPSNGPYIAPDMKGSKGYEGVIAAPTHP